jgi:hypothetical protein
LHRWGSDGWEAPVVYMPENKMSALDPVSRKRARAVIDLVSKPEENNGDGCANGEPPVKNRRDWSSYQCVIFLIKLFLV